MALQRLRADANPPRRIDQDGRSTAGGRGKNRCEGEANSGTRCSSSDSGNRSGRVRVATDSDANPPARGLTGSTASPYRNLSIRPLAGGQLLDRPDEVCLVDPE
jgi:hypothetical protein